MRFFSGYSSFFPSPQKPSLPNSNSIWNARTRLNELLRTPLCSVCKQITIVQGQYSRGAASLKLVNLIHVSFFRNVLSCLQCNLTSLLSFEGCCSQERETCPSRSRALGTNGEVKCQTSSAQRGLLLLYYYKTRQDICYRNITRTIVWHAVSKKTLVEACQINSITNQILYYNK